MASRRCCAFGEHSGEHDDGHDQVRRAGGHPHDQAGELLVFQGRQSPQGRAAFVGGVPRPGRERHQHAEDRRVQRGGEQIHDRQRAGEAKAASQPEVAEQRRSGETIQLIGYPGPRAEDPDLKTLELLSFIMNGAGGRLSGALAGKGLRGSAAFTAEGFLVGGAAYVIAIGPAGSESAIHPAVVSTLEQLSSTGPAAGEIDLARTGWMLLRQSELQDQHLHSLKYAQAVFNRLPPSGVDDAGDAIAKISTDDVKRLASKYFKKDLVRKAVIRGSRQ